MPDTPKTPIIDMRHVYKSFGPVRALADVNLVLYPGEVLGLVGDNSAGKSTLIKIPTGAYQREHGEILVAGQPVVFKSPHESRERRRQEISLDLSPCRDLDVGQHALLRR